MDVRYPQKSKRKKRRKKTMATTATTKKFDIDDMEMPMASDMIEDTCTGDNTVEEDVAEMFRNRNIKNEEAKAIRAAREQDEVEDDEREAERKELEAARTARIKGRKKACLMLGAVLTAVVIGSYTGICSAIPFINQSINALMNLAIGSGLIGVACQIYKYIKHEIYSNL